MSESDTRTEREESRSEQSEKKGDDDTWADAQDQDVPVVPIERVPSEDDLAKLAHTKKTPRTPREIEALFRNGRVEDATQSETVMEDSDLSVSEMSEGGRQRRRRRKKKIEKGGLGGRTMSTSAVGSMSSTLNPRELRKIQLDEFKRQIRTKSAENKTRGSAVAPKTRAPTPLAMNIATPEKGFVLSEKDFVTKVDDASTRVAANLYAKEKRAMQRAATGLYDAPRRRIKLSSEEKKLFNEAVHAWNDVSSKEALKLLEEGGVSTPEALGRFMLARHSGLDKEKLGLFFGGAKDLQRDTFRAFLVELPLRGLEFLPALRRMIAQFRLPGEGQVIDRVMRNFCSVYCEQNPDAFQNDDNCHTLCMLTLTLNTATHNPNEDRKIKLDDWVLYCEDLSEAEPLCTHAFLTQLWHDIKLNEIRMPMEGLFPDMVRRGFLDYYKPGFLGGWRRRWFVVADSCFYMFDTPEDEDPLSVVPLSGVRATRVDPTHKRDFVFCVESAIPGATVNYTVKDSKGISTPGSEKVLMFAAVTDAQRQTWIDDISGSSVQSPKMIPFVDSRPTKKKTSK